MAGPVHLEFDDLPPALASMWRLCKLGYRHEPGMLLAAFVLALLAALPDALLALWFKLLGEGVLQGDRVLVRIAAVALGMSVAATWLLRTVSTRESSTSTIAESRCDARVRKYASAVSR